jgi:hypothetical protein
MLAEDSVAALRAEMEVNVFGVLRMVRANLCCSQETPRKLKKSAGRRSRLRKRPRRLSGNVRVRRPLSVFSEVKVSVRAIKTVSYHSAA